MSLKVETLIVSDFMQNCRVIYDEVTKEAVIIDPGGHYKKILSFVKDLKPVAILLTHGHLDHSSDVMEIKKHYDIPIYAHRGDEPLFRNLETQARMFGLQAKSIPQIDHWLKDQQIITLLGEDIKVLHTPGHSPGSCCFFLQLKEPVVIVGDVLFAGSIGRTDLWGGDLKTLLKSIREKLFTLPKNTIVMSGHGPNTTIDEEEKYNPFLN